MYTREEVFATAPCHVGLEAKVRIGCTKEEMIKSVEHICWMIRRLMLAMQVTLTV
ncbi:hypothetical protein J14TS2_42370 [Bacillus sp. J14TS2]|uniref:hypothetical protein n=1 Tax=Bacillus sp. J14TS2 TaxID=2807188 RepID=UPI001B22EDB5|nr:hypothetical protein [Bacillus sp. J14TS2]GIN73762.1 hypothetical protein J14TS2_42370 [Bacillus sp. J14TS2]